MNQNRRVSFPVRETALKTAAATLCVLATLLSLIQDMGNSSLSAAALVNDGSPMIALTFVDGPYSGTTCDILDILEEYGVPATFFVLGSRIHGREDLLRRMEALGCEVGNHTWSHADLTRLSKEDCVAEIEKTNAELKRVLGHGAALVRPPFGFYNSTVRSIVPYPLVLWSLDTQDWREQDPASIAQTVANEVQEGFVILMHDQQAATAAAIAHIIPALLQEGFRFVTVSELIATQDVTTSAVKLPP